ncbi:MAG: Cna B-type domain-containing protein, partial [Coprococcus sp.]
VDEDDVEGYTSDVQLTKDENDVVTAATITNKLNVGSLVITKFFSGDLDDTKLTDAQKKQITFTISGPEGYKGPTIVTYDQFYLGSYVINNAPYGKYTVTETSAAFDGYTHKVTYTVGSSTGNTAADVVISSSTSSLVTVANEYKAFITVSGTKVWDDNNNQDGKRAEDIKVRLMNGTTEVASKTVTPDASGNWNFSFADLPKYDDNGNEIAYTVKEDAVAGYDTKITGDVKTGFVITNSHTPETIDISGTKT